MGKVCPFLGKKYFLFIYRHLLAGLSHFIYRSMINILYSQLSVQHFYTSSSILLDVNKESVLEYVPLFV